MIIRGPGEFDSYFQRRILEAAFLDYLAGPVGPPGPQGPVGPQDPGIRDINAVAFVGISMGGQVIQRVFSPQDAPVPARAVQYTPARANGPSEAKDVAKTATPKAPGSPAYTHACEALKFLRGEPNNYMADFLAERRKRLISQLFSTPQFQIMLSARYFQQHADESNAEWEDRMIAWGQKLRLLRYDGFERHGT